MSLFDGDSSVSTSDAASSASDTESEGTLPAHAPPVPPPRAASTGFTSANAHGAPLTVLEQRRRMAEADAAGRQLDRANAPWRSELRRRPLGVATAGSVASTAAVPAGEEQSKFGASIAAAMRQRRDEKEKALLRRLQEQRKAEAQGSEGGVLAQKDLDVGVFVTASYREVLKRNIHSSVKGAPAMDTDESPVDEGHSENEEEDDDDDPIGAYLRQLERKKALSAATVDEGTGEPSPTPAVASSRDYYDRIMTAPLHEQDKKEGCAKQKKGPDLAGDDTAESASQSFAESTEVAPPTLSELRDLVGGLDTAVSPPTTTAASRLPASSAPSNVAVSPMVKDGARQHPNAEADEEAHSALVAHARLVFDSREARRQRTATDATIFACARRCDDRIAASLFCSTK